MGELNLRVLGDTYSLDSHRRILILPEADVVKSLIVNAEALVSILHQLVDRESGVVGLHHGVRHLGGGDDGECVHDPVGILLPDLGDEKCSHTRPSSTSQGVG